MIEQQEFDVLLGEFVAKYRRSGWEMNEIGGVKFAENLRVDCSDDLIGNYWIVYDEVFRVPMLCAQIFYATGQQISYQDLLKHIPENLDLGSLSEREHPLTGEPVFFLHTCKTAKFIQGFLDIGASYLHVWLNRYGPVLLYRLEDN